MGDDTLGSSGERSDESAMNVPVRPTPAELKTLHGQFGTEHLLARYLPVNPNFTIKLPPFLVDFLY